MNKNNPDAAKSDVGNNFENNFIFVLASVLKQAKDVRMYEKIGKSLIKKYKNATFHFVGQASNNDTENIQKLENIHFHELFNFNRIALKRFYTFFTFLFFLLKIKPNILVIGTFELLLPSAFYKIFSFIFLRKKVKIIYDVQENYVANISYTKVFLPVLREMIAIYVYLVQKVTSFFVDFFFLAEYCYEQELSFIGKNKKKYVILPNFILREDFTGKLENNIIENQKTTGKTTHLLFLGTISQEYGLQKMLTYFEYITKKQQEKQPKNIIKLTILGHCPLETDFLAIKKLSKTNHLIDAQINQKPIPYAQIKEKMKAATQTNILENTFVVMPYIINKSYEKRIPTKFYECLAYDLPMIIQKNTYWEDFFKQMQKLIPAHKINVFFIDFDDKETPFDYKILSKKDNQNTQNSHLIADLPIFWDICEEKLNNIDF